jgi:hypothetical protein
LQNAIAGLQAGVLIYEAGQAPDSTNRAATAAAKLAPVPFTAISGHQDSSGSVANYASGTMATSELGGAVTSIALSLLSLAGGVDFAVGSVATLYGLASNVVA